MLNAALEFAPSDGAAGFRLHRLEVYNWGTFHGRVWMVEPGGKNSLLTGDIGSGKSTLVDAVTTLLVPPRRIAYNKAAGAEAGERSLRSYVLGYYKAERGDDRLSSKPVALRDENSYSVVLAYFYNEGYDRGVTLAQAFWLRDGQNQPERLYVVAERELTIVDDFSGFGTDLAQLRRRLRESERVRVHNSFTEYAANFRRQFGIEASQALELFHQTVSMKSVGNLTDFVRTHMLEPFPVEERIQALIDHFDDLDRAHKAVLKAKAQIDALTPLAADIDLYEQTEHIMQELRACREGLRPWFGFRKARLLEERLAQLDDELEQLSARIETHEQTRRRQSEERDDLKQAIAASGGDRLQQLERAVDELTVQRRRRQQRAEEYAAVAKRLGLDEVADGEGFLANRRAAQKAREKLDELRAEAQNALTEEAVAVRDIRTLHDETAAELQSLRGRRSNIPQHMVALRQQLCRATKVREEELPFAGELIEVREEAREWEGAVERLLHGFGLSLLVPERHYAAVADWVERTDLRGRLVYYRTRPRRQAAPADLHPHSIVHKLALKTDAELYPWVEAEIRRRFDYAACTDMEQFRREERAVTRFGQVKDRGIRHEKDDRHRLDDRTRYILGWTNEQKIAALEREVDGLRRRLQDAAKRYTAAQGEEARLRELGELYVQLDGFREFDELDWRAAAVELRRVQEELESLRASSDRLRVLQEQLRTVEARVQRTEKALDRAKERRSARRERREEARRQLERAREAAASATENQRERVFPLIEAMWSEAFAAGSDEADGRRGVGTVIGISADGPVGAGAETAEGARRRVGVADAERADGAQRQGDGSKAITVLTVENADDLQSDMREWLNGRIDMYNKRLERTRDRIIEGMQKYKHAHPLETRDVDVAVEAAGEYRDMLERLQADDLPRFEAEFQRLLRENTIREVANFQAQLNRERELITERIDTINLSLHEIDYNPGRFIRLHADRTNNVEVREFQAALRACTEGAVTGSDEQYSEQKFLQVKAIIERFRGRDGMTDLDRRWTRHVTDVRNWFVFSASERWREDDVEYEHYTDAAGKSGGQKEKLAYTVLAAGIAYQFGLEWGETRSRSFRFVVIDEAFGRGSDESARYGLELFQKLNLQALVVTPLQKIHVIEPFVSSVAFVHNEDDRNSMVRNMTIEEYRAEKESYSEVAAAGAAAGAAEKEATS